MRFLILAHTGDTGAIRVAAALEQRLGFSQVVLVSDAALAQGRWVHHLGTSGVSTSVRLADGRRLLHDEFVLVFNRLRAVLPYRFAAADEEDQFYARAETNALMLSWLSSFTCPVVPAPAPPSLSPVLPPPLGLFAQAGRAGLPTRAFAFCSNARLAPVDDAAFVSLGQAAPPAVEALAEPVPRYQLGRTPALHVEPVAGRPRRLLIVGGDVLGPVPSGLATPCTRFAEACGCEVLALLLDRGTSGTEASTRWRLCGADALPALTDGAEAVAVARYLEHRAELYQAVP